jgi:hypothetical protein
VRANRWWRVSLPAPLLLAQLGYFKDLGTGHARPLGDVHLGGGLSARRPTWMSVNRVKPI